MKILAQMFPKALWYDLCFSVVISSGGEVPPAHELKPPRNLPRMSGMPVVEQAPEDNSHLAWSMSEEVSSREDLRSSMFEASQLEWWRTHESEEAR